ncbi:hypothetical protein [Caballeronia sp. GAFFF2]|uniref:hypothetical protein n=1 Tax=Caballeronia sp. GAFFF2 TaxID=2921741 RepID=UPI0020279C70|nr:hypothetical protein [Caballeronia sp. GAFFF2]
MRDLPILFSGAMVRAILDGRKTQTRRVVKARPGWPIGFVGGAGDQNDPRCYGFEDLNTAQWWTLQADGSSDNHQIPCPYGARGDRLWVRETFQGPMWEEGTWDPDTDYHSPKYCEYRADGGPTPEYVDFEDNLHQGWKPSIFMPRWASRIALEITGVRVERLEDIGEEDALAEGVERGHEGYHIDGGRHFHAASPRGSFASLWDSLNASRGLGWDVNPWVWVVEFKRIEA